MSPPSPASLSKTNVRVPSPLAVSVTLPRPAGAVSQSTRSSDNWISMEAGRAGVGDGYFKPEIAVARQQRREDRRARVAQVRVPAEEPLEEVGQTVVIRVGPGRGIGGPRVAEMERLHQTMNGSSGAAPLVNVSDSTGNTLAGVAISPAG